MLAICGSLAAGMGTFAGYWQGEKAQQMARELRSDAQASANSLRVEAAQSRDELRDNLSDDIERLERDHRALRAEVDAKVDRQQNEETRRFLLEGLRADLARIEGRLDRLETAIYGRGPIR
jgi:hypothetical protein